MFIIPGMLKILHMEIKDGVWTKPDFAFFTSNDVDACPWFSPDGDRFFFKSRRPVPGISYATETIWVIHKTGEDWSDPEPFGYPFHPPYAFAGGLSWQHTMTA